MPTLYDALTRDKSLVTADLACLRAALSGADRLPRPVKERFEALVARRGGQVKLLEGYGLTEAVTAIMAMPLDEYREGSIGVPFPDMLAKICSPGTLEEVPPGREGEICIAGPTVMIGYLDDPEATRQALRQHADGRVWLHTGDLGRMDADGFFYFTDRLKRMIKSSGFNVFPAQVEAVLYTHPQVLETCVVGVPDPAQVERVKAFVVLKNRALPGPNTEKELIALCRSQLIKWSCPREIEFRRELPKTRIGKIDYQALVAEHVARHATSQPVSHGGDRVAAALQAHGVRLVFTLCGGHISPILVGAKARGLRVVDVRDEATAVFAADAVARLTGVPGVAAVTAGPGVTNTLTALKNAQLAQSPVVLLGGAAPTALQGRGALQDIDQGPVVAPHVKLVKRVRRVRDLTPAVEEAFAVARDGVPGPAFVECPVDLLYDEASVRTWYGEASGQGDLHRRPAAALLPRAPRRQDVRRNRRGAAAAGARGRGAGRARIAHRRGRRAPRRGSAAAHRHRQPDARARRRPATHRRRRLPARDAGLSLGHGARPARARSPAADASSAPAGAAGGGLRRARRRAVRLPPRLRSARAPRQHPDRRQPQRQGRALESPPRHRGDRRRRRISRASRRAVRRRRRAPRTIGSPRCAPAIARARPRSTNRRKRQAST